MGIAVPYEIDIFTENVIKLLSDHELRKQKEIEAEKSFLMVIISSAVIWNS